MIYKIKTGLRSVWQKPYLFGSESNDFIAKKIKSIKNSSKNCFAKSLEKFLAQSRNSKGSSEKLSFPYGNVTMKETKRLNDVMWRKQRMFNLDFSDDVSGAPV